ncbi:hypothetical protein LWC34_47580 [Kibdelosporangium philippinense]|uniref:Uncharacterized protein n=1 Tax=Kibdelosporangium philippinense TaxID=211113 RepID=A0ABS8ZS42_9PSEU|nr:hypothetical protein [Kibdelosporangium philippinense]MCE7010417.1 hypothetical protein [Kibdelosporangium philippinense]
MVDAAQKRRLTVGVLSLIPAFFAGMFLGVILQMSSAGCGSTSVRFICSPDGQMVAMWLSPAGAVLGMIVGGLLGIRWLRQGHPVTIAILTGWLIFAATVVTAWVLATS